jgi:aspartate racemase
MKDRIIGILGGMGPQATLDLYREIISLTPATMDQNHIRVLIYSNPKIPDRTSAILAGGESPLPELIESAKILEQAGAGILTVPCNAAHYFVPEIQKHIGIPILHMIEETCKTVRTNMPEVKAVGLLAATLTVKGGLYRAVFEKAGIKVLEPSEEDQKRVHAGIFQVKAKTYDAGTYNTFHSIGAGLIKAGAGVVILGCTEVPLAFDPERAGYPSLNATRVLAQAAVNWALEKQ